MCRRTCHDVRNVSNGRRITRAEGSARCTDSLDCDWRGALSAGLTAGLRRHLPKAVGIVVCGLAACGVAEVASVVLGLHPLITAIMRAIADA